MFERLPIAALICAAAASGCAADNGVGTIRGRLTVAPPLADLGTVANGVPSFFNIELSAADADIKVSTVSVLNIEGDYFMTLDQFQEQGGELPEGYEAYLGAVNVEAGTDAVLKYPVVYFPLVEGYHTGRVTFTHDGRSSPATIDIRAQSDRPEASITPWTLDFGLVKKDHTARGIVKIQNLSQLPLAVTVAFPQDLADQGILWTPEPQPVTVPPNTPPYEYEINFDSPSDALFRSSAAFAVGIETLRVVQLKANDCEGGIPDSYDQDGDGFSACFGDCDDNDRAVNPAAQERINNLDDNCDGDIDEGTNAFDDDGDGYCESAVSCNDGSLPGDCNDGDDRMHPGNDEDCPGPAGNCTNGIDDDCDGIVDNGTQDADGDGYTVEAGDCDDGDPNRHPGKAEIADGVDNDCDGIKDEGTVLYDDDGDGFCEGKPGWFGAMCSNNPGTFFSNGDCDDSVDPLNTADPRPGERVYPAYNGVPGGDETADRYIDNNCDGDVDEGTVWADNDGDGYTEEGGDCDDNNPMIGPHMWDNPSTTIDEDCDNTTP